MKKFIKTISAALCILLALSLCACSQTVTVRFVNKNGEDLSFGSGGTRISVAPAANTEAAPSENKTEAPAQSATEAPASQAANTETPPTEAKQEQPATLDSGAENTAPAEPATETQTADGTDPANWTMQQIVDCYSSGMQTTDDKYDCYTAQKMQLVGKLPGKASALSGPVNLAMKLGSQPFNALTGGYWALCPDDLVSATARKDGKYVVIDLVPKEQTDGPGADEHEGHTGHVVNVVQGIDDFLAYVEEHFGILHAQYTQEGVKIHYRDAFAKNVRINTETGEMESGEWGYTIDLHIDDASVLGVSLDDFNVTIQYNCWYPVEE